MERDMDLVRLILRTVAECNEQYGPGKLSIDGFSDEVVHYHCNLLIDAGLADGSVTRTRGGLFTTIHRLTWEGHDFVDAARDATRWNEAKGLLQKVGGASFDVWKSVLTSLVTRALGL